MRRAIMLFALVAPILAIALWRWSSVAAVGVVFVSHMLILYPTLRGSSQWLGRVVTSFEPRGREVWITIDDGPHPFQTPAIIETLRRHGARATFFVKGALVRELPEVAASIVREGHEIANHSHSHPSGTFWALSKKALQREIDDCQSAIAVATGVTPTRFRAPVGMKNPFVHPLLSERALALIGWSARAFDGVGDARPETVIRRLRPHLRAGAIILLHEGRKNSPAIVEALLEELAALGLEAVIPADEQLRPLE